MTRFRKKKKDVSAVKGIGKIQKKKVDDPLEDQLVDDTMYGEIIPSLMGWTSSEDQKQRSNRLIEISEEISTAKGKKKSEREE